MSKLTNDGGQKGNVYVILSHLCTLMTISNEPVICRQFHCPLSPNEACDLAAEGMHPEILNRMFSIGTRESGKPRLSTLRNKALAGLEIAGSAAQPVATMVFPA